MAGVTLDSNIYVSAFEFGGICARLMGMARAGDFRLDLSDPIIDEVLTVLREDFHWNGYRVHDAWQRMLSLGKKVTPSESLQVILEDPDHDRVLECAVTASSDYIITNDKDLLRLKEYAGIRIVTPAQFLKREKRPS